ncbi:MAG: ZIP family metal transporter [Candidatus Jordarchaeum sp.]|uniref:ZIP family metal transporter n=1 Tax=Candidatus Jordarchaeum sp. TaxID=2823881 RepID=UPI00404B5E39
MYFTLTFIVVSTVIISLLSLVGIVTLALNKSLLDKILFFLIAFAAGALMGGAFFHILPESVEHTEPLNFAILLIVGFSIFFLLERVIYWRHCHEGVCDVHPFTYLNLFGDGIHNFIDGVLIAASYMLDINLGIVITLAVIAHEIPQEIGDYGILVYGGFERLKALGYNLLTALTAIIGALITYFVLQSSVVFGGYTSFVYSILPFAAGGFIYIASSDLIPELHKEQNIKRSIASIVFFLIGIILLLGIKYAFA